MQNLPPIDIRHHDIKRNGKGLNRFGECQTLFAVTDANDLVTRLAEAFLQHIDGIGVIINGEDSGGVARQRFARGYLRARGGGIPCLLSVAYGEGQREG